MNSHTTNFDWTTAAVAMLRAMHADGAAFSAMGDKLGITRNACIGKARRIGLPTHGNAPINRPRKPRKPRHITMTSRHYVTTSSRENVTDLPPEPVANPATLLQLTDETCRWPIGDPHSADFAFCGAMPAIGHPYCGRHCDMAYTRPMTRAEKELALREIRSGARREPIEPVKVCGKPTDDAPGTYR